ncbi:hypothetical protein KIN20_029851 [Parelaphostrongylus tenuis]|uniref:Uncharacterized protein n=1 Tax=Parelaphostrongylus tenuis TaxID=148309 RepID=A0AAD5R3V2_PARTN|nr:hypothetical protein KIN20_029851 [Parelaphostrongylus tenuis]
MEQFIIRKLEIKQMKFTVTAGFEPLIALSCQHLDEMANSLASAGRTLVARRPETETTVALRINTINSAMQQLRLRRCTSDSDTCSSRSNPSLEIRSWIHSQEKRLVELEQRLKEGVGLTKLQSDQQDLIFFTNVVEYWSSTSAYSFEEFESGD